MQWENEHYQHHKSINTDIDVKEREEQKSFMKRSDLEADSMFLKCLRKEDWKSRCIHCKECIKVENIHTTF